MRRLLVVGAALFVVLGGAFATNAASPKQVTAVTHSSPHPDTTNNAGDCTLASDGGPVWAYDNLSLRLVATPGATAGDYSVTIFANGSFQAFANPNTGACYNRNGSVDGWYTLDVQSAAAPDPKNLPSQVPGSMSQGSIVNMLFGGSATVTGQHYSYTYNQIDGGKYVQNG
jgi:hypothetical protein